MTDLETFLQTEAEHAEANKDAPLAEGTTITQPGGSRGRVYSTRLTNNDVAALEDAAERAGVPASTLARTWIVERLADDDGSTDLRAMAETLDVFAKRLKAL